MKKVYFFALLIIILITSCKKENNTLKTYKVVYSIACTDCEVIYYKDSLQTEQTEYHKNNSWTYTFNAQKGQAVLLLAYNTSSQPQGVTATISLNDSVLTTQTNYCPIASDAFVADSVR